MPETIDYKVNIDASSVADQLQQLKGQLDQAMASYTFSATTPDPTPQAYAFPTAQFTQQMGVASQAGTEMSRDISTSMTMAQEAATSFTDTARLGYQKFTRDVQNTMLMTPAGVGTIPFSPDEKWMPSFRGMSQSRAAFEAITGYGHENGMSISPGRYRERARNAFSDNLVDWTVGAAEATGTALSLGGLVAGGLGYTGAAAAMGTLGIPLMLAEGFMATAGYDIRPAMQARSYIRDTSWRTLMGETKGAALDKMALDVVTAGRTNATLGYNVSNTDAMQMVQGFTEVGGFDNVRTADEYSKRVKMVVENSRYLQEVLQASQKEVLGFMKEGITMGLMNDTTTARQFGLTMAGMAYKAGYTPSEFHTFGMQSAEMVRGTGIYMGAGYIGGQGALAITKDMMRSGNLGPETVMQMGGAENTAATVNRLGWNFGLSDPGFTFLLANKAVGPAAAGMGPTDQLAAALGQVNSLGDFLNLKGQQPKMASKMGAPALFGAMANQKLRLFKMIQDAEGVDLNEDTYATVNAFQNGTDRATSDLEFAYFRDAAKGESRIFAETIGAAEKLAADQSRGTMGVAWDLTKNKAAQFFGTRSWAQATMDVGNSFDRGLKKISDLFSTVEYRDWGRIDIKAKPVKDYLLRDKNEYKNPRVQKEAQDMWEEGFSNTIGRITAAYLDPKSDPGLTGAGVKGGTDKNPYLWLRNNTGSWGTIEGTAETLLDEIKANVVTIAPNERAADYLLTHNKPEDISRMTTALMAGNKGYTRAEAGERVTTAVKLAQVVAQDKTVQASKFKAASDITKLSIPEIDKLWAQGFEETRARVYGSGTPLDPVTGFIQGLLGIDTGRGDPEYAKMHAYIDKRKETFGAVGGMGAIYDDLAGGFGAATKKLGVELGKNEDPFQRLMHTEMTPELKAAMKQDLVSGRGMTVDAAEELVTFATAFRGELKKSSKAEASTQGRILKQVFGNAATRSKMQEDINANLPEMTALSELGTEWGMTEAYGLLMDRDKLNKKLGTNYTQDQVDVVLGRMNSAIAAEVSTDPRNKIATAQANMLKNYESVREQTADILAGMGADLTQVSSAQMMQAQGDLTNNYLNKIALAMGTTAKGSPAMRTTSEEAPAL